MKQLHAKITKHANAKQSAITGVLGGTPSLNSRVAFKGLPVSSGKGLKGITVGDVHHSNRWIKKHDIATGQKLNKILPVDNPKPINTASGSSAILAALGLAPVQAIYDSTANAQEEYPIAPDVSGSNNDDLTNILSSLPLVSNAGNTSFSLPSFGLSGSNGDNNAALGVQSNASTNNNQLLLFVVGALVIGVVFLKR